jgi:CheY-like chemotaxis protein
MNSATTLFIDDSASVREVLRVAFESEGYQALEAADGREGVRLIRGQRRRGGQ